MRNVPWVEENARFCSAVMATTFELAPNAEKFVLGKGDGVVENDRVESPLTLGCPLSVLLRGPKQFHSVKHFEVFENLKTR